jgi:hypothetical protein
MTDSKLSWCDCCNEPMVRFSHYGPDRSAAGCDTDACILCVGFGPSDAGSLEEEILELARFAGDIRVGVRLEQLSKQLDAAYEREGLA